MTLNERFLSSFETQLNKFLTDNSIQTLKVQSPMGTGKTNIIYPILKIPNIKVMFVTNRVSLGEEFKERFKEFGIKFYKDNDFEIGNSIITQFDSLWKYNLENFDLIILDEFISVLLHSLSFLTDKGHLNLLKLNVILNTKKIVILDAFFTKDLIFKNCIEIINEFREEDVIVNVYENKNYFLSSLLSKVKENRKITISCSSLILAKSLFKEIQKISKNVFLLSSETRKTSRENIIKELKNQNSVFDVFIFTPTITTGIDILSNFEEHWHIDEGNSCDVISSLQMLKRTRNSKEINIYISGTRKNNLTDIEKLNKKVLQDIQNFKISNPFLVEMDYTTGNYSLSRLGVFYNQILAFYNSLENNHKKKFLELLKLQFKNIVTITKTQKESPLEIKKLKSEIQKELEGKIRMSMSMEFDNSFTKRAKEIQDELKNLFNISVDDDILSKYVSSEKYYKKAKNRMLFSSSLKKLKEIRKNQISKFNFDTTDLDKIICFKEKNFQLKDVFYKKELDKKTIEFLSLLGYKTLNNKMILEI